MNSSDKKNPYQDTLNLPHTDFSIRANAQEKEPEILSRWEENQLHEKATNFNEGNERYILHDGPPYSNGHIHLGTAFNKILKDITCKFRRMSGYHVPFIPGWDCHGLPIELKVTTELGLENNKDKKDWILNQVQDDNFEKSFENNKDLHREKIKQACREYAHRWITVQRQEFRDIGVLADWTHPYITMSPSYEADILRSFAIFVEKGYIERKGKTIPWCFSCQTALATAEIEYKDRKDPSCYILFDFDQKTATKTFPFLYEQKPNLSLGLLIWTTTPWTLPLNRAVTLNPTAVYSVIEGKDPNQGFIVAKDLVDKVCQTLNIEKKELAEFDADTLKGKKVHHPFIENFEVPIIFDNSVLLTDGTACVHCAPGCGPEDYLLALKNNLEVFSPLSSDGRYTQEIQPEELRNTSIVDGQIWVIKKLHEKGKLIHKATIQHSYPHCWRCRNGLMFRATDQWFCDLQKHDLVKHALKTIETISFIPSWGKNRLQAFIQNRSEWCISRQRIWGVPITALICNQCDYAYLNAEFIRNIADKVTHGGIEYWDRVTLKELIDEGFIAKDFVCVSCGNNNIANFKKEQDILDVWFDSGVSHTAVLAQDNQLTLPADLYLEGSDQHRGWFQSSLLSAQIIHDKAPMKTILTHGYIVDEHYHKMSKSLGNTVAPQDVIKKYSRDILRLWVASTDFEGDVVISEKLLQNVSEVYRKIRNTCRFLISNLYDFDIHRDSISLKDLLKIDQYILAQLHTLSVAINDAYEQFHFARVVQLLNNFCANNLSAGYLDICKDRLYVETPDGRLRRSAQTALYHILDALTHLMAPILSFTAEEISDYYLREKESIHLKLIPMIIDMWSDLGDELRIDVHGVKKATSTSLTYKFQMQGAWTLLEELRGVVLKALEEKRQQGIIKHSLEARITFYLDLNSDALKTLNLFLHDISLAEDLNRFFKDWFIVSQVVQAHSSENLTQTTLPWAFIEVDHALGTKCPRCWQWDEQVSTTQIKAHCEFHKEHHQAEMHITCSCKPTSLHETLCVRCRKIVKT